MIHYSGVACGSANKCDVFEWGELIGETYNVNNTLFWKNCILILDNEWNHIILLVILTGCKIIKADNVGPYLIVPRQRKFVSVSKYSNNHMMTWSMHGKKVLSPNHCWYARIRIYHFLVSTWTKKNYYSPVWDVCSSN